MSSNSTRPMCVKINVPFDFSADCAEYSCSRCRFTATSWKSSMLSTAIRATMLSIRWRRDWKSAAFGRKAVSGILLAGRLNNVDVFTGVDCTRLSTANALAHINILLDVDRHWSLVCTSFCVLSHTNAYPAVYRHNYSK